MNAVLDTAVQDAEARDADRRRRRSRMIRAILAGGLVLGVGTAVTLAAWNDSEFATGTFRAGVFDLEGSTDGTDFDQHASGAGAATLSFTLNPTSLSPGDVVTAPFALRLAEGSTTAGDVVIGTPTSTGTVTNLTYEVVRVATVGDCSASATDTTGTSLITAETAMTAVAGPNTFELEPGATEDDPGDAQVLCFKVTAGGGLVQGQSGTVTWQFTATSKSS